MCGAGATLLCQVLKKIVFDLYFLNKDISVNSQNTNMKFGICIHEIHMQESILYNALSFSEIHSLNILFKEN